MTPMTAGFSPEDWAEMPPEMPFVAALAAAAARDHAPFYAPGHKRGQGSLAHWRELVGLGALRLDLPELPELDNLFAPTGPLLAAQRLAAQAFGAEETYFLANGTTCGLEAAILATCGPGDRVLIPRNAHRSILSALVLSGAQPIYLAPLDDPTWDLAYGLAPKQVATALAQWDRVRAVVVVSPTYQGVCADVAASVAIAHAHQIPVIVDEAHGPHFGVHPDLPPSAIAAGADIVVQSTHKVLSALSQASMLHCQGDLVDRDRLRQALRLTQSTSPNALLLASLDAARYQYVTEGRDRWAEVMALAHTVRSRLGAMSPLTVLTPAAVQAAGASSLDLTRLTVDVSALGITGFTADEYLNEVWGVTAELPTLRQLTFILSVGNTAADGDRLVHAFQQLIATAPTLDAAPPVPRSPAPIAPIREPPCSPRDAFFAMPRSRDWAAAIGHISADSLCPYPPGIPVILPGEVITKAAIAYLQAIQHAGGTITGSADPQGQTVRVVEL